MTERERSRVESERSGAVTRRLLLVTMVVLTGVLLGYRRGPSTDVFVSTNAGTIAP